MLKKKKSVIFYTIASIISIFLTYLYGKQYLQRQEYKFQKEYNKKFKVVYVISEAIKFPYFVLLKTDLIIPSFNQFSKGWVEGESFSSLQKRYYVSVYTLKGHSEFSNLWYTWLSKIIDNQLNNTFKSIQILKNNSEHYKEFYKELVFISKVYREIWPKIYQSLYKNINSINLNKITEDALKSNEDLLELNYIAEKALIYFNFLPTKFAQSPTSTKEHRFVLGKAYLINGNLLKSKLQHELRHILINQTGIFESKEISTFLQDLSAYINDNPYMKSRYNVQEAMNFVSLGIQFYGWGFPFDKKQRKFHSPGQRKISESFYLHKEKLKKEVWKDLFFFPSYTN